MKKIFLICLLGLVTLNLGCSSSGDSSSSSSVSSTITSFNLDYEVENGSSSVTFDAGNYDVLLVDQDFDINLESVDYDFCADSTLYSGQLCSTFSSQQEVSGNAIDYSYGGTLTSSSTSITVPFELDADDFIILLSTENNLGCYLYMGQDEICVATSTSALALKNIIQ